MVWLERNSLRPATRTQKQKRHPGEITPTQPASLAAPDVLGRLRELIEEGRLPPGAKLPPERTLAAELGAGRPALREAIKVLGALGILETRRSSGTFVKAVKRVPEAMPGLAGADNAEFGVLDWIEARKLLEPRVAWLAATRAGEKQLLEIENARQRLEMHYRDWRMVAELDYELHAAIFRGARNPALFQLYRVLMSGILGSRASKVRLPADVELMRRHHRAIVEAILERQADVAERAMADHIHSEGIEFIREADR